MKQDNGVENDGATHLDWIVSEKTFELGIKWQKGAFLVSTPKVKNSDSKTLSDWDTSILGEQGDGIVTGIQWMRWRGA